TGVGELAAERDVRAVGAGVLGIDEHERRGVGELAVADRVGPHPRIRADLDHVRVEPPRSLALATGADDQDGPQAHACVLALTPRCGGASKSPRASAALRGPWAPAPARRYRTWRAPWRRSSASPRTSRACPR